jgi:hypothetical protein
LEGAFLKGCILTEYIRLRLSLSRTGLQNHELNEQLMKLNQLDDHEKNALIKIINYMLTKKRMKDLLDGKVNF